VGSYPSPRYVYVGTLFSCFIFLLAVKAKISPKAVPPPYARVVPALALFQVFRFLAHEGVYPECKNSTLLAVSLTGGPGVLLLTFGASSSPVILDPCKAPLVHGTERKCTWCTKKINYTDSV